jgi:hypothetical protein
MSADQLTQPAVNRHRDERALVNLYRELTGENESQARSAFMFVICDNEESSAHPPID